MLKKQRGSLKKEQNSAKKDEMAKKNEKVEFVINQPENNERLSPVATQESTTKNKKSNSNQINIQNGTHRDIYIYVSRLNHKIQKWN